MKILSSMSFLTMKIELFQKNFNADHCRSLQAICPCSQICNWSTWGLEIPPNCWKLTLPNFKWSASQSYSGSYSKAVQDFVIRWEWPTLHPPSNFHTDHQSAHLHINIMGKYNMTDTKTAKLFFSIFFFYSSKFNEIFWHFANIFNSCYLVTDE